jgi:hypothetical protein
MLGGIQSLANVAPDFARKPAQVSQALSRPRALDAPNLPLYINTSITIYCQGEFWVHESTLGVSWNRELIGPY